MRNRRRVSRAFLVYNRWWEEGVWAGGQGWFSREGRRLILDENERPMVAVHVCWNDNEADIVVSVLRDGGIEARVNSEVPHNVLPITANGLAKVEVLVREGEAEEARGLLATYEERGSEGIGNGTAGEAEG